MSSMNGADLSRRGTWLCSALILMTDTWLKAINEGILVGCAMIDFRKAFDLVDHELLLKKKAYL